jgi:programmed cell death 6-interacting protein
MPGGQNRASSYRQIGVAFSYHTPFPPAFSITPDAPMPLNSLTFERAAVLFNVAALYASMAAAERRAELEGIKRALGYLTVSWMTPVYARARMYS